MRSRTLAGSILAVFCILHLCSALPIQLLPAVRKGGGGRGGGGFSGSRGGFSGSKGGSRAGSAASKIGKKGWKRAGAGAGGISDGNDTGTEELCFPGSAKVFVRDRGLVEMRTLKLGECVEDASNEGCSRVYAFSHRVTKGKFNFVQIESKAGRILKLTKGHYIYVNGELKAARDVRVGDVLQTSNGTIDRVRRKINVQAEGLFNPQTFSGDIVVDGLRASTFTEAVRPGFATALLAPLRIAFAMCGIDASAGVMESSSWIRQTGVATLRTINLVS